MIRPLTPDFFPPFGFAIPRRVSPAYDRCAGTEVGTNLPAPAADPLRTDSPGRCQGEIASRIITETCNAIFSSLARFVSSPERFWEDGILANTLSQFVPFCGEARH